MCVDGGKDRRGGLKEEAGRNRGREKERKEGGM
jgi:hypothetical protein